ncbi:basic salivary proline-rich protein 2-like [Dreissena polymorpha]|nr:basic salivary proline-rich protein 2-like [Dreissena polymorpha]
MAMMMATLARNPNNFRYASCTFNDTWTTVKGRVDFRQFLLGEGQQQVQVRLQLSGLPVASSEVERGIHVHDYGDIGAGCSRVGPHFNPGNTQHGSQRNFAYLRHVGNLGNIRQSTDGLVSTQFVDGVIALEGTNDIVGRSFVIKLERDDEGVGGSRDSRVNGNTRTPIACCVIGRTTAANWYNPMSAADIQNMARTGLMPENRIDPFAMNTNIDMGQGGPGTGPMGPFPGQPGSGFPPGMVPQGGIGPGGPTVGGGPFPGPFGPGQNPFGFGAQTGPNDQRPNFGGPIGGIPPLGFPQTGGRPGFGRIDPSGSTDMNGFGPGPQGFGPIGFGQGQSAAGRPPNPQTGFSPQGGQSFQPIDQQGGFMTGGFPQGGFAQGSGPTQNSFNQGGFQGPGSPQGSTLFGPGTLTPGFGPGPQSGGFGPVGFGQVRPAAGRPATPQTGFGPQGGQSFQPMDPQGGLTQDGFSQGGGSTQNGFSQEGFQAGSPQGATQFGSGSFTPGAAQGQTFNFNQQGKRK